MIEKIDKLKAAKTIRPTSNSDFNNQQSSSLSGIYRDKNKIDRSLFEKDLEDEKKKTSDVIFAEMNFIFIKKNQKLFRVDFDEIRSIGVDGNYSIIFTKERKFAIKISLVKLQEVLGRHWFVRVNKKNIININLIQSVDLNTNEINLEGESFRLGRTYREDFFTRIRILS